MSGYSGFEMPPLREVPRRYVDGVRYLVGVQMRWLRRPQSLQARLTGFDLVRVCAEVRADLAR